MIRRNRRSLDSAVLALSAVVLLAACGDDDDILGIADDPATALATLDSVIAGFFTTNDALTALDVLGPFISGIARQPDIVQYGLGQWVANRLDDPAQPRIRTVLRQLQSRLLHLESGGAAVPEALRGSTLVWDPVNESYVVDANDDGAAPANGVRFRLYTADPGTTLPAVPLDDIGFIDIVDASTFDWVNVSLKAVVDGTILLDYGVNGPVGVGDFDLRSGGYLSDGSDRLNFSLDIAGTPSLIEPAFALNLGSFRVDFQFNSDIAGAGNTLVLLTDRVTGDIIEFNFVFESNGAISDESQVIVNGRTVALFVGTVDEAFLAAVKDGSLSRDELQTLGSIFNGVGVVFEAFTELFFFGISITGR